MALSVHRCIVTFYQMRALALQASIVDPHRGHACMHPRSHAHTHTHPCMVAYDVFVCMSMCDEHMQVHVHRCTYVIGLLVSWAESA